MHRFRRSSSTPHKVWDGRHRTEHWYRDQQVYFITARCRDRTPVFATHEARAVFWDRFTHYTAAHGFTPFVTSLISNHYHTIGFLRVGEELGPMMRKLHGSVAKLTNDLLEARLLPFWRDRKGHDYFDGCIRDELQCRRAYGYTLRQSVRHRLCRDWRDYPDTRVGVDLDVAVRRALELRAFMEGVPYARYERGRKRKQGH